MLISTIGIISLIVFLISFLLYHYVDTIRRQATEKIRLETDKSSIILSVKENELNTKRHEIASLIRDIQLLKTHNTDLSTYIQSLESTYEDKLKAWKIQEEKRIREDAVARSRQVQKGFAAEAFAPLDLEYDRRDYRFLGDPVDFVIFSGSSAIKDGTKDVIDEIIFLDIKTGESTLNTTQRRIRDAISKGRVRFGTYNTDTKIPRYWGITSDD